MDTCGKCKHINGVCLSVGFCDKKFCEVRTDRPACSAFGCKRKPVAKAAKPLPVVEQPKPQPDIVEPQPAAQTKSTGRSHSLLNRLTSVERLYLITHYDNTPMSVLAAKFGVSTVCLLRTIKQLGVKTRRKGHSTDAGQLKSVAGVRKHFAERKTI